ncbi:MAG: deoxyribose-phosphate aldolase [Ferruginibacter sp.]|uniref:deoxyribose-phosphate aldolase n=1 Tax=Ferruginibacter sp. TaxID=1940288 RepID=UPI00265A3C60|nr:deoxyribose-phosphate aldolase [Ferruginibacter sp.]MDB5280121.1 deoxyribose-phosphate aldolase [Ferruginibacter sp.]
MNIASYIDHTVLKPTTLVADVEKLCAEAIQHQFAAVCVPPLFVKKAAGLLAGSSVKVATVIGFPFGYSAIEAKVAETVLAIVDGADELDLVINISALKNNDWQFLAGEINAILPIVRKAGKVIKIIIESGVLTDEEIIKCCDLYGAAGVDFMKTSTGYAEKGATVEAVKLLRKHLSEKIQIKASGGIKTYTFAKQLIDAGATRIGCSSSIQIVNEAAGQN